MASSASPTWWHLRTRPPRFQESRATNRAGCTEHFEVFYDRELGENGRAAGAIVLNRAERDLQTIREWFNLGPDGERFAVVLARMPEDARTFREPASSGDRTTLFCDIQTTPRLEALQSSFFVAAPAGGSLRSCGRLGRRNRLGTGPRSCDCALSQAHSRLRHRLALAGG